jgi:long-chain acyl-CoA synthetase
VTVVGAFDDYRGETIHAFVSLRAGRSTSEDVLIGFARDKLASYKCPRKSTFSTAFRRRPAERSCTINWPTD